MSDTFLLSAKEHDEKVRKQRMEQQRYDTKIKNADKLKAESDKPYIKPSTIRQMMFEKLEEGLMTKIPKENKGF